MGGAKVSYGKDGFGGEGGISWTSGKTTTKQGEVLVKMIIEGESSRPDGRQSKPFCPSCYIQRADAKSQARILSLAFKLQGKGHMLSSRGTIMMISNKRTFPAEQDGQKKKKARH